MATIARLMPVVDNRAIPKTVKILRQMCSSENGGKKKPRRPVVKEREIGKSTDSASDELIEPTNCCGRGCANCVWIRYAEKLSEKFANSNEDIQKLIMEKVEDPNMRAFLAMELRCRNIK